MSMIGGPKQEPLPACVICGEPTQFLVWGQRMCDAHAGEWHRSTCPTNEAATAEWVKQQKRGAA